MNHNPRLQQLRAENQNLMEAEEADFLEKENARLKKKHPDVAPSHSDPLLSAIEATGAKVNRR